MHVIILWSIKGNCTFREGWNRRTDCVPKAYELRPFSNRSGPFLTLVIKSCHSVDVASQCRRVEGACYGICNGELTAVHYIRACGRHGAISFHAAESVGASCLPIHKMNVIIHGPNGTYTYMHMGQCPACGVIILSI